MSKLHGKWIHCTIGFVILTRILKFIGEQGYSHYFDDADSNGVKIFGIKALLGVANRRRSFGFGAKNIKICQFLGILHPSKGNDNWNKH